MKVTQVNIRRIYRGRRHLLALASVSFDRELAVHDVRVIRGVDRIFIAMPNRVDENRIHRDIVHPISYHLRGQLEEAVLAAYRESLQAEEDGEDTDEN